MVVTIFGATGIIGAELITHALAKGWKVKAFSRNIESLIDKDLRSDDRFQAIKGYVFDAGEVKQALKGTDLVLSALGGDTTGSDRSRSLGMKNIVAQMTALGLTRIVALGGKGVLPLEEGGLLMDDPDFPPEMVPVSMEHKQAYDVLVASKLDWTFVCAPTIVPGTADNDYVTLDETATDGDSVSAGNLALFMVEEAVINSHVRQRVSISDF